MFDTTKDSNFFKDNIIKFATKIIKNSIKNNLLPNFNVEDIISYIGNRLWYSYWDIVPKTKSIFDVDWWFPTIYYFEIRNDTVICIANSEFDDRWEREIINDRYTDELNSILNQIISR